MGESFWTDDKVAQLRRCLDASLSASAISVLLGCSRNAVIGKTMRIKRRFHGFSSGPCMALATEEQAKSLGIELPPDARVGEAPKPKRKPDPTPFDDLPAAEDYYDAPGVKIEDLTTTSCRAIVGGDSLRAATVRYCGEPIAHDKLSYCAEHFARYFIAPPRLKARLLARL